MKIGGLWLLVFGYTIAYVGWQNLNGNTISFVGAIHGDTPTSQAASANDSQPSILSILGTPFGWAWQALNTPLGGSQSSTTQTTPEATPVAAAPRPSQGGTLGLIQV